MSFDGTLSAEMGNMEITNLHHGLLSMACLRGKSTRSLPTGPVHEDTLMDARSALDFLAHSINADGMFDYSDTRAMRAFRACPIAGS